MRYFFHCKTLKPQLSSSCPFRPRVCSCYHLICLEFAQQPHSGCHKLLNDCFAVAPPATPNPCLRTRSFLITLPAQFIQTSEVLETSEVYQTASFMGVLFIIILRLSMNLWRHTASLWQQTTLGIGLNGSGTGNPLNQLHKSVDRSCV